MYRLSVFIRGEKNRLLCGFKQFFGGKWRLIWDYINQKILYLTKTIITFYLMHYTSRSSVLLSLNFKSSRKTTRLVRCDCSYHFAHEVSSIKELSGSHSWGLQKYPQKYALSYSDFRTTYGFLEMILTYYFDLTWNFWILSNTEQFFNKKALKSVKLSFNSVWNAE